MDSGAVQDSAVLFAYLYMLFKALLLLLFAMAAYTAYAYVYQPYKTRSFYACYHNVVMSDKYTPFMGEYAQVQKAKKENKYAMAYVSEYKMARPRADLALVFSKNVPYFYAYSPKAVEEFLGKLVLAGWFRFV